MAKIIKSKMSFSNLNPSGDIGVKLRSAKQIKHKQFYFR